MAGRGRYAASSTARIRAFVVVGPCSIHRPVAGLDYARRLKALADEVSSTLLVVMRRWKTRRLA